MSDSLKLQLGTLLFLFFLLCGCSGSDISTFPDVPPAAKRVSLKAGNRLEWGRWMLTISESRDSIRIVPARRADLHLNVTKLVETSPCENCLTIGNPILQPDGTIKLKVRLRHPYPGLPQFTGFDVRGVVIFPATRHWYAKDLQTGNSHEPPWYPEPVPIFFSWRDDEGGFLLNNEGYSYYFWPGFNLTEEYQLPIYKYHQGEKATSHFPDSMINPFIQFNDGSPRRMFKTTDYMMREYHIKLPPGEFTFGYVVQASWAPPNNIPVVDPETDFPVFANAEDPFYLSFDQYIPMNPYQPIPDYKKFFAHATYSLSEHTDHEMQGDSPIIYCPDMRYWQDEPNIWKPVAEGAGYPEISGPNTYTVDVYCTLPDSLDPDPYINGTYPAVAALVSFWHQYETSVPVTMRKPTTFHLIEVELLSTGPD